MLSVKDVVLTLYIYLFYYGSDVIVQGQCCDTLHLHASISKLAVVLSTKEGVVVRYMYLF